MESSNKWEMQQAILWNMRCLRSGFGRQTQNHKATEPAACIGTAGRGDVSKVSIESDPSSATSQHPQLRKHQLHRPVCRAEGSTNVK
jgi:hypothetical protein